MKPPHEDWTRREFLAAAGLAAAGLATGCAQHPVSGRRRWMLVSEAGERRLDAEFAPHQFSADYGAIRDPELQAYLAGVGAPLAAHSHRPHMPYSFRALYASHINAYTFPAGSIGVTRGILLELPSEAALAALLGHEIGHVAAQHAAARMSQGLFAQLLVLGLGALAAARDERYAPLAAGLGAVGAGALLAKYSRTDEREADQLGMEYLVRAGYPPDGMVELMDRLRQLQTRKPHALERLFASHPMSDRRYGTAVRRARDEFPGAPAGFPAHRERYLDSTARLRARQALVQAVQGGDRAMVARQWDTADGLYLAALREDEADYEALLKLAQCRIARNRPADALDFAGRAQTAFPDEPQALHVRGLAALKTRAYETAAQDFDAYLERLPGNPMTLFLSGRAHEGLGNRPRAIERYRAFLGQMPGGEEADYARKRLAEWNALPEART